MKAALEDYLLLNRHTGKYETATLYSPIGDNNVDDFESQWRPVMKARLAELKAENKSAQDANLQDAHWKWKEKHQDRAARTEWESFSVECDGETQGLMFIKTVGFAREKSQLNKPIAYIDLISTAPWNRRGFDGVPKYKGTGHVLLGAAVSLSTHEGFDGRIGLHSLPQSESWYRDICGMSELGSDSNKEDLVYFEFTSKQAHAYIKGGGQ